MTTTPLPWIRRAACGVALAAAAACGIDVDPHPDRATFTATPLPGPISPFIACAWYGIPIPNQNIGFTGFGYWGDERGFRIHHGNYNALAGYLEYKITVIWSLPGCSGTDYFIRFPDHGLANHTEIEVHGAAGALKGSVIANKGSLPVLYNQSDVALPTHALGPFVIKPNMVGGFAGMGDTIAFTLLDRQILSRLPAPVFYNGALPANQTQTDTIAGAYDELVEEYEYLHEFFEFRVALDTMTATARQVASDAIDLVKEQPGPIHNSDMIWEESHHVSHAAATSAAAIGVGFGGFWNGHRNLIYAIEEFLRGEADVPPFGRVPVWDPALSIPAEFAIGIDPPRYVVAPGSLTGNDPLDSDYQAANICANYASSQSAAATLTDRLIDMEDQLWSDLRGWHDGVHISTVRGDMSPIQFSASVPLFYPWHEAVDYIWRNWQLCEAGYHPLRYSWDEL